MRMAVRSQVRRPPSPGEPISVVFGRPAFSPEIPWESIPATWNGQFERLASRVVVEHTDNNALEERLLHGSPPVSVVVPITSPVTSAMIEHGSFGLIQQFGTGTDSVDIDAAAHFGVRVANMPGLNAVSVAEHAIMLLLGLARRIPEARDGFRSGHWGEPAGRSLAGTTAVVIGLGSVGTEIARRLAAFNVMVIGVRRHVSEATQSPLPGMHVLDQSHLREALKVADSVIIAASYSGGQPALIDAAAIAAMRPGAFLINIARGGLLDDRAALAALDAGHLGGLGLDVFREEPYPADGPLTTHPRVIATAHTAWLTQDVFHHGARRLADALDRWVNGQALENLVV
jgi:phosphoglycerate dehydrogenase-like enzyme